MGPLTGRYRRTGATLVGGDLWRPHGTHFEGWFWRFTDVDSGRVVVALLGINRPAEGPAWATAGIAMHPGGFSTSAVLEDAWATRDAIGAGAVARAVRSSLSLQLPDASIDVRIEDRRDWPLLAGGVGAAHVLPGLSQYWHPWLLGGRVAGSVTVDGIEYRLDGSSVYAEKNWGPDGFPRLWWWGQAQGFDDPEVGVAFAGGLASLGGVAVNGTSLVAWHGDRVKRVVRPIQRLRVDVGTSGWRLRGGGVEVEGSAATAPHVLPVPLPDERRNLEGAARQHLAGEIALRIRRRGRLVYSGTSNLAGLEHGLSD